jgi:hypothetical protein
VHVAGRDGGRRVRGILLSGAKDAGGALGTEDAHEARWAPGTRARRATLHGEDVYGARGAFMEKRMPVCEGR